MFQKSWLILLSVDSSILEMEGQVMDSAFRNTVVQDAQHILANVVGHPESLFQTLLLWQYTLIRYTLIR